MKRESKHMVMGIMLLFAWLMSYPLVAQNITVKGTVTEATFNEPVIGATIVLEGDASRGTVTDIDGNFTLGDVPSDETLVISYVGYATQYIPVAGQASINIILQEDAELLDEVVVTGYGGTQLRSKSTNSISKVTNETLSKGIFANPAQALSGAVSGLRVIQSSGDPGATPSIILRGGTNFDGSGSPLIIVDGMVRPSLSDINPNDIESMEVMKDAGATAIYGARANNGVVLITTRRGKSGTGQVEVKARVGINYINNPYEFANARDYLYWQRTAYQTASQYFLRSDGQTWEGKQHEYP